ncbi:MAG: arsenite methyltransferase [Chloroflexi bacterium]|nr:arsenite methyltransferase [Chloroflexota bacterium]
MTTESQEIKRLVSERYANDARVVIGLTAVEATSAEADACCAPSGQERAMTLYEEAQLSGLPAESIAISLGCGNPTALAGLKQGERVLDLGSGGGIDCFLAAQQVGESGHVIGLDMTPVMLDLARSNQAKLGLTNVEFVKGEIENIPLPDASVDVVISNCVVCLSPDKDAVFREAFRVLSPGGRLHISDMMALNADGPARKDTEAWVSCSAGAEPRETYLGRLRNAGFEDVVIEEETACVENDAPADVSSVKVVARKPGQA